MVSKHRMSDVSRLLGRRIAELRGAAGMTQEGLADALDSAKSVVSRIESGSSVPSLGRLVEIANALGVEPRELLTFEDAGTDDKRETAIKKVVDILRRKSVDEIERVARVVREAFK